MTTYVNWSAKILNEQKKIQMELDEIKDKYNKLNSSNVDQSIYREWDSDSIIDWILSLNEEYKKYEQSLRTKMKSEGIDGSLLSQIERNDLDRFGVKELKDKIFIIQKIKRLTEDNKIEILEQELREEREKVTKSKHVINALRTENREIEDELVRMNHKIESDLIQRQEQRKLTLKGMNQVVDILENNEERMEIDQNKMKNMKKKNDEITQQLSNLANNINENKSQWVKKEKEYQQRIEGLEREKYDYAVVLKGVKNDNQKLNVMMQEIKEAKINTLRSSNQQMDELRIVIKAQQIQIDKLQSR